MMKVINDISLTCKLYILLNFFQGNLKSNLSVLPFPARHPPSLNQPSHSRLLLPPLFRVLIRVGYHMRLLSGLPQYAAAYRQKGSSRYIEARCQDEAGSGIFGNNYILSSGLRTRILRDPHFRKPDLDPH
jgi:hypothetical protein